MLKQAIAFSLSGLAVYFGYGIRHSKLGQHAGRQHRATQEEDRLIQAEDADDEESQFSERWNLPVQPKQVVFTAAMVEW